MRWLHTRNWQETIEFLLPANISDSIKINDLKQRGALFLTIIALRYLGTTLKEQSYVTISSIMGLKLILAKKIVLKILSQSKNIFFCHSCRHNVSLVFQVRLTEIYSFFL